MENMFIFKYHFKNNTPIISIAFKVNSEDVHQNLTKGIEEYQRKVLVYLWKSQLNKVESALKKVQQM